MQFENPDQLSLNGNLLLADPSLQDPSFRRSVLLISFHRANEGAEGVILNRPLYRKVADLTKEEKLCELGDVPVYLGGPVNTDHLVFASFGWNPHLEELEFRHRLSSAEARARLREGYDIRAFIGYAGWTPGQLENELREHAWIPHRPDGNTLGLACPAMWTQILEKMSPWHYLLSKTPDDPSLN